jgi:hypothetical protein
MPRGSKRGRAAKKYKTHIIRGITCLSALDRPLDRACENGLHLRGARDRKPSPAWLAAPRSEQPVHDCQRERRPAALRGAVGKSRTASRHHRAHDATRKGAYGAAPLICTLAGGGPGCDRYRQAVEELSGTLKHCLRRDIGIEVQVPDAPCFVTIDRGEFELAALNLAVNARDAMPKGGMFRIIVTPQGRQPQRKSAARSDELVAVQFSVPGSAFPPI